MPKARQVPGLCVVSVKSMSSRASILSSRFLSEIEINNKYYAVNIYISSSCLVVLFSKVEDSPTLDISRGRPWLVNDTVIITAANQYTIKGTRRNCEPSLKRKPET